MRSRLPLGAVVALLATILAAPATANHDADDENADTGYVINAEMVIGNESGASDCSTNPTVTHFHYQPTRYWRLTGEGASPTIGPTKLELCGSINSTVNICGQRGSGTGKGTIKYPANSSNEIVLDYLSWPDTNGEYYVVTGEGTYRGHRGKLYALMWNKSSCIETSSYSSYLVDLHWAWVDE